MRCPVQERLAQRHISVLDRVRTAEFWDEVVQQKVAADAAWKDVVEHRRRCGACRPRTTEMESSVGVPAWRSGIYG